MPNVLSSRDLVSRPDKMDKTVLHTFAWCLLKRSFGCKRFNYICYIYLSKKKMLRELLSINCMHFRFLTGSTMHVSGREQSVLIHTLSMALMLSGGKTKRKSKKKLEVTFLF